MPKAFTYEEATEPAKFSFEDAQPEPHGYEPETVPISAPAPKVPLWKTAPPTEDRVPVSVIAPTVAMPWPGPSPVTIPAKPTEPFLPLPKMQPQPGQSFLAGVGKGAVNVAVGLPEFAETSLGMATAVAGPVAPRALSGLFAADMVRNVFKQIPEVYREWNKLAPEQRGAAFSELVLSAGLGAFLAKKTVTGWGKKPQGLPNETQRQIVTTLREMADQDPAKFEQMAQDAVKKQVPIEQREPAPPVIPALAPAKEPEKELVTEANAKALPNAAKEVEKPLEQPAAPAAQPEIQNAPQERKVQEGVQPERVGTDAQRLPAKAGVSDSLQPEAPKPEEAARPSQDSVLLTPSGEAKPAPAVYLGFQGTPSGGMHLYNLTEDIPGHPKNSTVTEKTLLDEGFKIPETELAKKQPSTPLAPGAREGAAAGPPKPSAGSAGTSATGAGIAAPEPARQPTVTPGQQKSQAGAAEAGKEIPTMVIRVGGSNRKLQKQTDSIRAIGIEPRDMGTASLGVHHSNRHWVVPDTPEVRAWIKTNGATIPPKWNKPTPMPPGPGAGRGEAGLGAAIVPGGKEFLEQDLVPFAQRLSQGIRQTATQIRRNFAPASVSPEAGLAAGVIRERAAELAQRDVQMRDQFHKQLKEWDHLDRPASLDFIDRVETGAAQPTMPLQTLSAELRNQFDRRVAEVRALGTGKLQHVITDYFPHIWKDADAAISWYARIMGKRPLRGPGSFLKHRSIPTTREGVNAGLEPVTWNPVELSLLKMHEIDRYIMGQKIFQELKDKGLAKFTRSGIPPDGFAVINDRIANVVEYRPTVKADGTPGSPERILRGHWYAQKDAAAVLNNFLSPGLEKFAWYRALRWMGNTLNMAQLGFSGYHGMFTMIDAGTSKLSLGIEQAARGEKVGPLTMGRGLAGTLVGNQVEAYVKGSKVLQEYTKPGSVGGDYAKIVDALVASGGRVQMPRIYKNSSLENFFAASRKGNLLGAAVRAPFAAIEAVSYPLMQNIVPRLKLGVFTDMAKAEIERMGPNVSREEFRRNMGKVWDSVDNRMGELVYDNLFWNRTLKDLSFLMVRAVGWNLGTIRELGGGVMDAATFWKRIGSGDPIVTKRMAYTMALPFTVGLMGAMYQYMKTGQPPEELRDYFYPKTGQTLPDGTVERVNFPSYLKDIVSYSRHPLTTVGHKLHPMWSSTVDMLNNKDFYGVQIRNKDDPVMQQLHQVARFVAGSYVPFSVKGSTRRVGSETSLETKAESFFGIMPISPELARTPAQNKIMEYAVAKMPRGARTPEEEQRVELVRDVQKSMLSPADQEQARSKLRQAQAAGTLTKGQRLYQQNKLRFITRQMNQGRTKTEALWLWRFEHLPVDEAQHVYELANPDEKKLFERPLAQKIRRMGRTTPRTDTE